MAAVVDRAVLASRLPAGPDGLPPTVEGLEAMVGGASSEIWSFVTGDGRPLVLRRSPHPVPGSAGLATQAAAMQAARAAGVPVPEIVAWDADDPQLGGYMVMARVDGETLARRIQRDDAFAAARARFATQCGEILGRLHRIDPATVAGLARSGDPLQDLRDRMDALGAPSATFEWALRHLEDTRPPMAGAAVAHGDFRLGNLIMGPEGIRAVLDWEGVHVGDPMEDLGWVCTKAWRFGAAPPVGGLGRREDLCAAYATATGRDVTPADLRWWEVLGTLRWGVICMEQASRHFHGYPSVELAAIGRRVAEVEWDLLGLLP